MSLGLLILFCLAGCTGPTTGTDPTPTPTITPTSSITVVFDNKANTTVDPGIYRSGSNLTADELFASAANRYQNFNGKTTIPAQTSVSATFLVTQAATLGSNQAAFGDLISFIGGNAAEKPVLHFGAEYNAGQTVTFTFSMDSSQIFHTTTSVK
jgi:hypothetical protein